METLFSLPLQQIALYIAAGAIAPALITLLLPVLRLPAVRVPVSLAMNGVAIALMAPLQVIRGSCYSAGKIASVFLTNRLGKFGRKLEDGLQEFVEGAVLQPIFKQIGPEFEGFLRWLTFAPFWKGLDEDDRAGTLQAIAEQAVLSVENDAPITIAATRQEKDASNIIKKQNAITQIKKKLGSLSSRIEDKAIDSAVDLAAGRLKKLRKLF